MITKIVMNRVASYKTETALHTDKQINLIYGLNGTGKSTLSNFLYDPKNSSFGSCQAEDISNKSILVYNQKFIRDYFYEDDQLRGIFTLSKENKAAEQKIRSATNEISRLEAEKEKKKGEVATLQSAIDDKKSVAESKAWSIKTTYSGGDRVLEYCLKGYKGNKEALFEYLSSLPCPPQAPTDNISTLKKEVEALQGEDAQKYSLIGKINIDLSRLETNPILQKEIVGNKNSTVSELIGKLDNSDWVKEGLEYIPIEESNSPVQCPFCQEKTITDIFVKKVREFFDKTYETDVASLKNIEREYARIVSLLPPKDQVAIPSVAMDVIPEFEIAYLELEKILIENGKIIAEKVKTPSKVVSLEISSVAIAKLDSVFEKINLVISSHNKKLDNKVESLELIKKRFWKLMRWENQHLLSNYATEADAGKKRIAEVLKQVSDYENLIKKQREIIVTEQRNTVNIDESIAKINSGLVELGIDGFSISKHSDVLYKIVRPDPHEKAFHSLSEGEKMVISFLYFCELCKGKKSASDSASKKIVVIDDPISSLSHIYVFNIGVMIKNLFFNSGLFEQVFVLTHSLYFFYDLTHTNKEKRHELQKLFRITKNTSGSKILEMRYEEIQNDYHAYWYVIKDSNHPPALIANCMRNIIEYFFNFIEKKDLNKVFQKPELADTKYQAFCRYVNRESHSLGQNIFDLKEFNYSDFKMAFELVFKVTEYEEHYKMMMR